LIRFVLKRIGYSVLTLFVLIALTFFLMRLLPGDPFLGEKAVPDNIKQVLVAKYGLDKPVIQQFFIYIGNILHGDFGTSMAYRNREVNDIIGQAFPYSFDLGLRALIFALVAGILLGVVASVNHGKAWDTTSVIIAVIGVSVPSFIMGAVIQYFVALKLQQFLGIKILPIGGWNSELSKLLPSFALGLSALATITRIMRTSMLDVINQDYIKTARAKGLSKRLIIWRHAIRNAILPVVTILGPLAANILTGAFVVELIFNIPGLGKYFVMSVQASDYTMISGLTVFYGAILIIANMLVDIAYGFIDPRIRLAKGKG